MVAEMLSSGDNKHLEEGEEKVLPPEQKDTPPESENSVSDDTEDSTQGSSSEDEEEEEEEEEVEEEGDVGRHAAESPEGAANGPNHGASADPEAVEKDNGVNGELCCEKCKAIRNHDYELITPRKISGDRLQLSVPGEGTFKCRETGLVFEVLERVQIKYRLLSWSRFGSFLKDPWKFAGPIFDVDCDPTILKSIQFPHCLCLADEDSDVTFSVLHIKNSKPQIEPSVDYSGSHIKWSVTSLSPVGPIVQHSRPAQLHGVVLVYKEVGQQASYSFRVYLAPNNGSDIKDIQNAVRRSNKKYVKLEKPPTCQRLLVERMKYRLTSEPEGDVTPADFEFTLDVLKMKGYFEVFFEQPPPFKLSLIEIDSDQPLWTATIREGDCVDNCEEKPKKRAERRKRSTSTSEEELSNKRPRWADEADGVRLVKAVSTDVTDQQLMKLAKCMGKEWKTVAISYLGLTMQELENLPGKEEELTMHKFRMLVHWRRQHKGEAGLHQLHSCLNQDDVSNEVRNCLEDMLQGNCTK